MPGDEHVGDDACGLIGESSGLPDHNGVSFAETLLHTVFATAGFIAALSFIDIPDSWKEPLCLIKTDGA